MVITKPPSPTVSWKKSKIREEDIHALEAGGLLGEKAFAGWSSATSDAWPMEKSPDEISMFGHFVERGLTLPSSDFFRGFLDFFKLEHVHFDPNSIFQIAVYVHFYEAFLGICPHWASFRKIFRLKPQPNANFLVVVGGAGVQMRQKARKLCFKYDLIDSNQDWKNKWFYIENAPPQLPKLSMFALVYDRLWKDEPSMQECIQIPELLAKMRRRRRKA
jgi:hypothetical protein